MSRIVSGDFVQQHTLRTTLLIYLTFPFLPQRQGTGIGGGIECLFVMIPVRQSSSRYTPFEHG